MSIFSGLHAVADTRGLDGSGNGRVTIVNAWPEPVPRQ